MHTHPVLANYRPTPRQAVGRGLYLGAWCAGWLSALSGLAAVGLRVAGPTPAPPAGRWLLATVAGVLVVGVLGGLGGLLLCRRIGTEADELGVRQVLVGHPRRQPWSGIEDMRAERHGGRVEVRAYLRAGGWLRLPAPYDGRLLARDRGFEEKYLTLRKLWEARRGWETA